MKEITVKSIQINDCVFKIMYRIDEDRYWFYKDQYTTTKKFWFFKKTELVNVTNHFTKQDLTGSIRILNDMITRVKEYNKLCEEKDQYSITILEENKQLLLDYRTAVIRVNDDYPVNPKKMNGLLL